MWAGCTGDIGEGVVRLWGRKAGHVGNAGEEEGSSAALPLLQAGVGKAAVAGAKVGLGSVG